MDPFTLAIFGIGAALGAWSLFEQNNINQDTAQYQNNNAEIAQENARIQAEQEAKRKEQMRLETMRNQREAIRKGQIARSQAISNAANQGALQSSGVAGGVGSIDSNTGYNLEAMNQNYQIGSSLFDMNSRIAQNQGRVAANNGQIAQNQADAAFWQGLSAVGGQMVSNAEKYGKVGSQLTKGFGGG